MNKIKAVIFDMDGVLIDTEPFNAKYYMKVFNDMGVSTNHKDFESLHGGNHKTFWSYFVNKYQIKLPSEKSRHKFRVGFVEFLKSQKINSVLDVEELISRLHKDKILLAVASSASPIRIKGQLKLIKLSKYFKIFVSGRDVTHGKPHPETFLLAAKKLGVKPSECLVIEDASRGVAAAKAARMKVVGFAGLPHNKEDLSGADKIILSFKELTSDIIQSL